jgi:PmbA protein
MPAGALLMLGAELGVQAAKKAGAQEAFAVLSKRQSTEIQRRDGKTERLVQSTSSSLAIQLWVDGRYGSYSTTDLRPDNLDSFLSEAVALTRALQPDPQRLITDPSLYAKGAPPNLDVIDPKLVSGLSADEREQFVTQMEENARKHERVISVTANLSFEHAMSACASSNGLSGYAEGTQAWPSVDVTLRDEGDRRAADGDWFGARYAADLPSAVQLGQNGLALTVARLGSAKGPTKKTTMVVDPRAASNLISRLLGPATASSLQQGRSFWAGKLGKKVLSTKLRIDDDPFLTRGLGSRPFDGEGIASRKLPIIADGGLQTAYVDTYYGRKGGMAPTTGSPSNRVVALGDKGRDAWVKQVGKGILVTSWLGGNADNNSGDFSFGARGHLIEKGKIGAPIGEINVTGNLIELFASLAGVGNDPWKAGTILAPTLVFEGVQFSGA